jgi:hypothetical protein
MSKRRLLALPLVFLVMAACDTGGAPQPSPSSKAWPTASPLAVYAGRNGINEVVSVVGFTSSSGSIASAKVLATVTVGSRTRGPVPACPPAQNDSLSGCGAAFDLPYVSTSRTKIYVLDGDATVKVLAPDASLTKVTSIPGTTTVQAAFAVSPDDSQIAVGVETFGPANFSLYVENLHGGGHVDVFRGTVPFYWPIGWRGGQIVLAMGTNFGGLLNPYTASGYALINPNAGARPVALGNGDCVPAGTVNEAGTACIARPGTQCLEDPVSNATSTYYYSCLRRVSWSGSETNFLLPSNGFTSTFTIGNAALSPDGQVIMTDLMGRVMAPLSDTHGGNVFLPSSAIKTSVQSNLSMGWISNELFSVTFPKVDGTSTQSIFALNPPDYNAIRGVPFAGAAPTVGSLVGTLPGGL